MLGYTPHRVARDRKLCLNYRGLSSLQLKGTRTKLRLQGTVLPVEKIEQ